MNVTKARKILYERSNRACEMCDRARAVEAHHRKNRSQGGQWSPENLLHLCHSCHAHVGRYRTISFEQGWAVHRDADPATERVWLARRGYVYLDAEGGITPLERSAA